MRQARKNKATRGRGDVGKARGYQCLHLTPPIVTGQCARALELIRVHQPLLSLIATADHAIPEFAARVHDLRALGFNIVTRIAAEVIFRGRVRHRCAFYSIGVPEWAGHLSAGGRRHG